MSKKSLRERWEDLKKGMRNGGLGGPGSVKAGAMLPSINNKMPKPGHNSLAGKVGIPNIAPKSTKDPLKSAEQTQNKDIKDLKMKEAQAALKAKAPEMIKFDGNGQWSLQKDAVNPDLAPKERKIKELQRQIDAGTYKPKASAVAESIVTGKPKKPETVVKFDDNGQWRIEKSNYGPKGMKLYSPADNMKRKQTRTSEIREDVGQNKAVRQYTTTGASTDKARMDAELKRQKAANRKSPVKTLKDLDPETAKRLRETHETKGKKP